MAPYVGLMDGMKRDEKLAVATYLVSSMDDVRIVALSGLMGQAEADDAYLKSKIKDMEFSPRIEELFEKRRQAAGAVDLDDERTRHMLGI